MSSPVKILELRRDQDWDAKLLKLNVSDKLRLVVAPSLYADNVRVFTDYPADNSLYVRNSFRELAWSYNTKQPNWDIDRYIDIPLTTAGPYSLKWTLENDISIGPVIGHGYFLVSPDLGYSPDSISCQTYITKQLGPLTQWRDRLEVAHQSGYNMIHFTPPQQLGSSRSAYSISNQLKVDSSYLPSGYKHNEVTVSYTDRSGVEKFIKVDSAFIEVQKEVQHLRDDYGILSIVDLVWNHTSFDTPWLIQVILII